MTRATRTARRKHRGFPLGLAVTVGLAAIGLAVAVAELSAPRASQQASSAGLAIGAPAPTFALPATTGGTLSLDHLRGTEVVVYFYEGGG
jgi:cytochrome oxidase Cu insertion factor (SCO1/SenC/PrrC family)